MSRLSRRFALCLALGILVLLPLAARLAHAAEGDGRKLATATFAGGCFWSMELAFDKTEGVVSATSGYTGGQKENPTYEEVSTGNTGHFEAVQVVYDSNKLSYAQLLDVFWHHIDPLTDDGQFCDKGSQYRSAIFVADPEQRRLAEASKRQLEESQRFDKPIVTEILPAATFYPAEDYHQDFASKNPLQYGAYRIACGRDARLKEVWGKDAPTK